MGRRDSSDTVQLLAVLSEMYATSKAFDVDLKKHVLTTEIEKGRQEVEDAKYHNELIARYGDGNIDYSGSVPKVKSTGFDVKLTPEWEIFELQDTLEQEKSLKKLEIETKMKEYYDLLGRRETVASDISSKHAALGLSDITSGFKPLVDTFEGISENDLSGIDNAIQSLNSDISGLHQLSQDIADQEIWFSENLNRYVGKNEMLDDNEFKQMVEDYGLDKKVSGYGTPGLTESYLKSKPSPSQRGAHSRELMGMTLGSATEDHAKLRDTISDGKFDMDDISGGNEAIAITVGRAMNLSNVEDFVDYLSSEEEAAVKSKAALESQFPVIMNNIFTKVDKASEINRETHGLHSKDKFKDLKNIFKESISASTEKESFGLYHEFVKESGLSNSEKKALFKEIETKFGGKDLGSAFMSWIDDLSDGDKTFGKELEKLNELEMDKISAERDFRDNLDIFRKWGTGMGSELPELIKEFRSITNNDPKYSGYSSEASVLSEATAGVHLGYETPNLNAGEMDRLREIVYNKAREWASESPLGWIDRNFTSKADRNDAKRLIEDWNKFENAYIAYQEALGIEIDPTSALESLKALEELYK